LGQLGDSTADYDVHAVPQPVVGNVKFNWIGGNGASTCGLSESGLAYCWGHNQHLTLGQNVSNVSAVYYPSLVATSAVFGALGMGYVTACGLTNDKHVLCWGLNAYGTLGNGASTSSDARTPVAVVGGIPFTELAHGGGIVCGLTSARIGYCWGYNEFGGTGTGSSATYVTVPTAIQNPSP
jgi:alpha-tubulin suppressor-like RCC1 family protein